MSNNLGEEIFEVRVYDSDPYLVLPKRNYKLKIGQFLPTIRVYVYQRADLFGDPLPLNIAGLTVVFNIYDSNNNLISSEEGHWSNWETSEVEYQIDKLDISNPGKYYGEFIFTDIDGQEFSLPSPISEQKILIIAS